MPKMQLYRWIIYTGRSYSTPPPTFPLHRYSRYSRYSIYIKDKTKKQKKGSDNNEDFFFFFTMITPKFNSKE